MSLKQQLQEHLKEALRARDERRKSVIRMAMAAIANAEVEHRGELDDADVVAILRKDARQRQDAIAELRQASRPDILAQEEAELAILEEYLPKLLSREEIVKEARQVIAEVYGSQQMICVLVLASPGWRESIGLSRERGVQRRRGWRVGGCP